MASEPIFTIKTHTSDSLENNGKLIYLSLFNTVTMEHFEIYINPGNVIINKSAQSCHGITPEYLQQYGHTPENAVYYLLYWLKQQGVNTAYWNLHERFGDLP